MSFIIEKGVYTTTIDSTTLTNNRQITFPDTSGTVMVSSGTGGNLLDMFYPVGSIYMSADASFNPNTSWGGTWVKIENRFLLGSGSKAVGATGGEENVTLTNAQIPSHSHGVGTIDAYGVNSHGWNENNAYGCNGVFSYANKSSLGVSSNGVGSQGTGGYRNSFQMSRNRSGATTNAGSGQSHNNMPPYQVVNVWRRTA